jgi:hypothetical protein
MTKPLVPSPVTTSLWLHCQNMLAQSRGYITERVCECLLAVVHRFLIRVDFEQDTLDLLENGAAEQTAGLDGGEFPEEANGASHEVSEAFVVDKFAQMFGTPGGGENEHVAELSASEAVSETRLVRLSVGETYS